MKKQHKLSFLLTLLCVGLFLQTWPTQAGSFQRKSGHTHKTPRPVVSSLQNELSPEQTKAALKNWVYLCAPCHSIQATGTENGPALLGEKAKKHFDVIKLKRIFAAPEDHGLSEAIPAFRKLNSTQREQLAIWFATLKKPEDIVVETDLPNPPPFTFVQNCGGCHAPDATGNIGPNLHGVGKRRSRETIIKLIEDPASVGIKSKIMPPFSELELEDRSRLADWLITLKE
jgi:mono/diheme cytochrome c family protein